MLSKEEKRNIYELMEEVIAKQRDLSIQFHILKQYLDSLNTDTQITVRKEISTLEKERIRTQDYFYGKNKTSHYISFDRVSKNILSILKQSPIPLSNKQLLEKLNTEYELQISYPNLTSNILPKMLNERSLPIEKAYRGYWQYRLSKL